MKKHITPICVATLIAVNASALTFLFHTNNKLEQQQNITIKTKQELNSKSRYMNKLREDHSKIESSYKREKDKTNNLQKENETLKANLQAKKAKPQPTEQVSENAPVAVSGDKQSWLAASGIPASEWGYVDSIVGRESGWNPNAVNPSSGACGLGQQLPCGKWGGNWNDPVAALKAQHNYVKERYGSYAGAVAFWNANHWY